MTMIFSPICSAAGLLTADAAVLYVNILSLLFVYYFAAGLKNEAFEMVVNSN